MQLMSVNLATPAASKPPASASAIMPEPMNPTRSPIVIECEEMRRASERVSRREGVQGVQETTAAAADPQDDTKESFADQGRTKWID